MNQDWWRIVLLAFGIAVGVIGVVAYLRLLRKEKSAAAGQSSDEASPSGPDSDGQGSHSEGKSTKG